MLDHDARHSSASAASISRGLQVAWRYDPQAISGDTFGNVKNAIATLTGIYVHWQQFGKTVFAGGPSFDGVSPAGQMIWSYCEHKDYDEGHWLSLFGGNVVFNDDGQGFLNAATGAVVTTGKKSWSSSYDVWGESIPDSSGLYTANVFHADGADLFVYSLDATGAARWTQNQQTSPKYGADQDGGLVFSNGVLFYAAAYLDASPFANGIYAFDASNGKQIAYAATTPSSDISADSSNIYLVEGTALVARSQSDLHRIWSVNLSGAQYAAPVLANGLIIVSPGTGIQAYKSTSGGLAWKSSIGAYAPPGYTNLAAATGSGTLVVTSGQTIYLLNMENGKQIWSGKVAGAQGVVSNPVIVSEPAHGATVYVTDNRGVIALTQT
jgi:hypothetical protein